MSQFIKVYQHVIPKSFCRDLIRDFENADQVERFEENLKPQFSQRTLTWDESRALLPVMTPAIKEYALDHPYLPIAGNMEVFRVKKYVPNTDDQFDWHCDSINVESSSRYLAILVYLNDVEEAGETEFEDLIVNPSAGSMVIFPPFWTHPHRGLPVKGKHPKYILSTYFRF